MAKPPSVILSVHSEARKLASYPATTIPDDLPLERADSVFTFLKNVGISDPDVDNFSSPDFFSDIIGGHLRVDSIQRGRISCFLVVKPSITNHYGSLHGGAVAAVAERLSIACAKMIVGREKEIFLGELSVSYLSAASIDVEMIVEGSVVRSGRNLTAVATEFRLKGTGKVVYTARATFYNLPISKL